MSLGTHSHVGEKPCSGLETSRDVVLLFQDCAGNEELDESGHRRFPDWRPATMGPPSEGYLREVDPGVVYSTVHSVCGQSPVDLILHQRVLVGW